MAFTRKFLSALGIDADKVDEIINAHTEVTDALKSERDSYKADADKLSAVQKELDDMKAAAEKDGKDPFKVKYEALKEDFDNYKKEISDKESKAAKQNAYRALLKEAGVADKRIDAVLRVSDVDGIKLDKDGKIEDADKLKESVKTEWADFITSDSTKGATTPNPPANNGSNRKTKDEIYAMKDPAERQKAILENHDLFGI